MPGSQQMTKTMARVTLAVFCIGVLGSYGLLIYVAILMEQTREISRQAIVAMNSPERLAHFEQAVYEERLISGLMLLAIIVVTSVGFWIGLRRIRATWPR